MRLRSQKKKKINTRRRSEDQRHRLQTAGTAPAAAASPGPAPTPSPSRSGSEDTPRLGAPPPRCRRGTCRAARRGSPRTPGPDGGRSVEGTHAPRCRPGPAALPREPAAPGRCCQAGPPRGARPGWPRSASPPPASTGAPQQPRTTRCFLSGGCFSSLLQGRAVTTKKPRFPPRSSSRGHPPLVLPARRRPVLPPARPTAVTAAAPDHT